MDKEQFYPTPSNLAEKLFSMGRITWNETILEPSAGTGSLLDALKKDLHARNLFVHCVETNPSRVAILKDKGYPVIWDDFMSFNPLMPYSTIVMNPPFHDGVSHLLKALQICASGGQIFCILNAETLKNPYTNERKVLIKELKKQKEYKVEYVQQAFSDAEHSTDVEVALIYIQKEPASEFCVTFENYKRAEFEKYDTREGDELFPRTPSRYGELPQMIDTYNAEVKAALALYREMQNYKRIALQGLDQYAKPVLELKVNHVSDNDDYNDITSIVRTISYKYWKMLLYSKELSALLTTDVKNAYASKLLYMADYEFNERNILQMKQELCGSLLKNIDTAIMDVFEEFTHRFAISEYSDNIHYYNGWKTNKAFAVNKKVIIPLYAFDRWSGNFDPSHTVRGKLNDIEKAMNYLDCGRTESANMIESIRMAIDKGITRNINTKFFTISIYKKGTCHLTFKDLNLLKKFNLYAGRKKNWLPRDYGCKPYHHLNDEEKAIVDSFEGKQSYQDTFDNASFYLPQENNILQLPM